ncbi:MAG: RidA family protein [Trebonia sp.]
MRQARNPSSIHPPVAAYSHHVEVAGPARWLVVSGQLGRTVDGEVPNDLTEQLSIALGNITANLAAANMTIANVIKITIYLAGDADPARRREVIADWLGNNRPTMTLVRVLELASPEYKVEVEAWAADDTL